jgi:glutaredoxin
MSSSVPQVVLYTRRDCELCDAAHDVLRRHGVRPALIDIDDHPRFHERYCECIPVVEIDGKVRFRGRVNPILLQRLLRRTSA